MRSATAILTVKLLGDNQTAKAFKDAQTQAKAFEQNLDKAAGVATGALVGFGAAAFGAAIAAEAVASANAVVANVLGNMGMDKATDRVLEYADSLEKSLGIDEKVIKTTQGKLATFSELAASADVAGGAFDRATMAALDMASAGFGSAEQNAVQLGKALQDPIKGITSLQRSGITFTEEQKNMIAAMVEVGDSAGAQNLILSELEKQVGGTAQANADGSEKMKLAFGEVAETLGTALVPFLDQLGAKAQAFSDWVSANIGLVQTLAAVFTAVAGAVVLINAAFQVYAAVTKVAAAVQWLLNTALLANPITWVVVAVMALIAALVLAYRKSDTFRAMVDRVWQLLKGAFKAGVDIAKAAINTLKGAFDKVTGAIRSAWDWLSRIAKKAGEVLSKLNPFKSLGGLFGGGKSRTIIAPTVYGTPRTGSFGGVTVNASLNPHRTAQDIARMLGGARVRTGFAGVRI